MTKHLTLSLALGLGALPAIAGTGTIPTKFHGDMKLDTLYHVSIGPGTTETRGTLRYTDGSDLYSNINLVTIDLTNPYVQLKAERAQLGTDDVKKRVGVMMDEHTTYANHYFAGVNGDFFGYLNCGVTVIDGMYLHGQNGLYNGTPTNQFVIGPDGTPTIASTVETPWNSRTQQGTVTYPDGATDERLRYQGDRLADYLVLYNELYQASGKEKGYTGTNAWGDEIALEPVTRRAMGPGQKYIATEITINGSGGNMKVPEGGLVLSGHGVSRPLMETVKKGDEITLDMPFIVDGVNTPVMDCIGGYPRLVVGGEPISKVPADASSDLALGSRRARTAIGYNADKTRMYILISEENSSKTNGLSAPVMADFLKGVGCHEALNLDGGGSSALVVENLGLRNAVQGAYTYQRPVMNGLFAVTNAPEDRTIDRIEIVDKSLVIKPGRGYVPHIYGYNKYGVLICTNVTEFTLSAPTGTATFNSGDRKMIAPASGQFMLTAKCGSATHSILVIVSNDGTDGVDPNTTAEFPAQETTPVPPGGPDVEPTNPIYAQVEDITPAGYDFDKYEAGTMFKITPAENATGAGGYWSLPGGLYTEEALAADGHVTVLHNRGSQINAGDSETLAKGLSVQDLGPNKGKALVYNQQWGPGANVANWPYTELYHSAGSPDGMITFYIPATTRNVGDNASKAIRIRLVMNALRRGRHNASEAQTLFPNIYCTAANNEQSWAVNHNGVGDNITGEKFPIQATDFARWENEGESLAEMPEQPTILDGNGTPDPWDGDNTTNAYIMNPDRFVVYEWDVYSAHNGPIAVHVALHGRFNTYIFKEIKFFNILNGDELSKQPRAAAPAKFDTKTTWGSFAGTRKISYRYYTEKGIGEIDNPDERPAGIDVVDSDNNAPVEYFNLQGIRVTDPSHGLYIRRQGTSTSKVIL